MGGHNNTTVQEEATALHDQAICNLAAEWAATAIATMMSAFKQSTDCHSVARLSTLILMERRIQMQYTVVDNVQMH